MENLCPICNQKFTKRDKRQTYCCKKCKYKADYLRNKEKKKGYVRMWQKNNPEKYSKISTKSSKKFRETKRERFNELMKLSYERNKYKCYCRSRTNLLLKKGKIFLKRECMNCRHTKNLEKHHEVYSKGDENIIKDVENGKIYYKCLKCHGRKGNHNI